LQRRLLPITATPPLHSQHWVLHGRSVTGEEEKNSRHKTKIKADLGKKKWIEINGLLGFCSSLQVTVTLTAGVGRQGGRRHSRSPGLFGVSSGGA